MQRKAGARGRPRAERIDRVDVAFIKEQITETYGSLAEFYREAFVEAKASKYRGLKQPSDVETVDRAFDDAFSGRRSLPLIYWRVLEELLGTVRENLPSRAVVTPTVESSPPGLPVHNSGVATTESPHRPDLPATGYESRDDPRSPPSKGTGASPTSRETPPRCFYHADQDRVAYEDAFLTVMRECLREGTPFLTATTFPPFFSRSREMQINRHERKIERLQTVNAVLERLLERYALWERLAAAAGHFVILDRMGHEHYFALKSNDFRGVLAEQIDHFLAIIRSYAQLRVGVSQDMIPETYFCGSSNAALTYHNCPPTCRSPQSVTKGTFHLGPKQGFPFCDRFRNMWENIPAEWKDKEQIAAWLSAQKLQK